MSMKLYVGNLSFSTTNNDLTDLFAQAGTVESARIVTDRDSGQSRGFGFVEMSDRTDGEAAISQFNGHTLDGRPLKVNEAKPQEARGGDRRNGSGGGGGGRFGKRY
jgi:RNA recognition motif-containing protein